MMSLATLRTASVSLGLALATGACAGSARPGAGTPEGATRCDQFRVAASGQTSDTAGQPQAAALPRYFTMVLRGSETHVDGARLIGPELSSRIQREADDASVDGVMVRLEPDFSGEVLGAIVWELSSVGFDHIIVAKQGSALPAVRESSREPERDASVASLPVEKTVSDDIPSREVEPASVVDAPDVAPDARLRTIGLHVGGGPNDDATRAKFIEPIEKHFEALLHCHLKAENRERNASVGVDLLIQPSGGRAEIKDLRTALVGADFQECIRETFKRVRFPKIERPTMVSYSMLFEPAN